MTSTKVNEKPVEHYDNIYLTSCKYKQGPKHSDLKYYYPSWKLGL